MPNRIFKKFKLPTFIKRRSEKAGLPPGALVHVGTGKPKQSRVSVVEYTETSIRERMVRSVDDVLPIAHKPTITWITVEGLKDVKVLDKLGKAFDVHPLIVEDILDTDQRPKLEDHGSYLYLVVKLLLFDAKQTEITSDQVSLLLGPNFVVSFLERKTDVFNTVRDRLRTDAGRMRKLGPDYLVHAILDVIVDNYFRVLEEFGEQIEILEEDALDNPTPDLPQRINLLKRELILLRRSVWPLREVLSLLTRIETPLVDKRTVVFLRDVYDHTVHVLDTLETFRDMVSGMLDVYLASLSNRMNSVMKVLTMIATIFIPLTFITGIYGMNFQFLPELEQSWGYPAVLILMATIALGMLVYFKKKGWYD
ncbi:MAG: magnesium/cobalt transporter CorA [Candidatus Kerfeldbacteria bacterium]|nr:magnesium/cobalt transporter CorA [Candidatus Kerfeldbacteria bacterium]